MCVFVWAHIPSFRAQFRTFFIQMWIEQICAFCTASASSSNNNRSICLRMQETRNATVMELTTHIYDKWANQSQRDFQTHHIKWADKQKWTRQRARTLWSIVSLNRYDIIISAQTVFSHCLANVNVKRVRILILLYRRIRSFDFSRCQLSLLCVSVCAPAHASKLA